MGTRRSFDRVGPARNPFLCPVLLFIQKTKKTIFELVGCFGNFSSEQLLSWL